MLLLRERIMIQITKIDDTTFDVMVTSSNTTTHRVTVSANYSSKLTEDTMTTESLVEKSFEFLLEREPNTSILRSFELSVIERYFPEYVTEIRKMLKTS
jgi:hypothetical protein